MENSGIFEKVVATISFVLMILLNVLANLLPLNGKTTGEISDLYPSIITPAAYTFSIWGLIYFLLLLFTLYQMLVKSGDSTITPEIFNHIRILFIISCFANGAWIIAWHYEYIALALMLIFIILICLYIINITLWGQELSGKEKLLVQIPFEIYFAWITAAAVINATVLLISIGWTGYDIPGILWASMLLLLFLGLSSRILIKYDSVAYALVSLWVYMGILVQNVSKHGYAGSYPLVIKLIILCMLVLLVEIGYTIWKRMNNTAS